jgi:hypothetical protein
MERQRLEEILRMCAEYQQEVDSKPGTKAKGGTTPSPSSVASLKVNINYLAGTVSVVQP